MAKKPLTPAQVKARLANPGERAKLDPKYLSPQQRQQRAMNARLDAPVVDGSSMTYRQAAQQRDADASMKYGDALNQSTRVQAAIPQWFSSYQQQVRDAQNQVTAPSYAAAAQQFNTLQAGAGAPSAQPQIQAAQAQAQQLGATVDPAAAVRAQQAAQVRAALVGDQGGVLAAQGAGQGAYAGNVVAAAGRSQVEQMLQEVQRNRDLQKEQGQFKLQDMQAIKDNESKSVLERQAFGLKAASTAADDARADASLALQKRNATTRAQTQASSGDHYGYTNAEWAKMDPAARTQAAKAWKQGTSVTKGGRAGTATPVQTSSAVTSLQKALGTAAAAKKAGQPRSKISQAILNGTSSKTKVDQDAYDREYAKALAQNPDKTRARQIATRAATKKLGGIPKVDNPVLVSAALDIAYDGHLSAQTQQRLQRAGYSVNQILKQLGKGQTSGQYKATLRKNSTAGQNKTGSLGSNSAAAHGYTSG